MSSIIQQLARRRLVPLIVIDDAAHALPLGDALVRGGLPLAEVTFRTAAAESAIRMLADRGDILVGAGTCLTTNQVDRAVDAGAQFIVTPGTNPNVVEHTLRQNIPIIPGVSTPTEIETALSLGVTNLKFFPAQQMGGVPMLKALAGPYADVRFLPTGGITPELLSHYLAVSSVIACGGSWLAPRDMLAAGRFDAVTALVEQAMKLLAGPSELET